MTDTSVKGHLELVPAFLYSLYLTLYKMDTSLRRTLSTGPEGVGLTESWLYVHTLPWFPRKSRPIKLGKVYTRPKRLKNPTLWGGTYLYRLHKVVSLPGGGGGPRSFPSILECQTRV